MRDHQKLRAFQLADDLAVSVYQLTSTFPREEIYGLTSQIRRAAVSVPSNIVEGCARESQIEYLRFLEIAYGSLRESEYQISLAKRLGYWNEKTSPEIEATLAETSKVLAALLRSLRQKSRRP